MQKLLTGRRIVVLAEDLYEDLELWYPVLRLREEGAEVVIAGTGAGTYTGKNGYPVAVDTSADKVSADDFDAVVIPGGYAPDRLRRYPAVLALVREGAASRIHLELGSGRVDGSLAPIFAYELPFFLLSDRHLRYRTGKLGVQIPSSGTDLRLDWRKIMATAPGPGTSDSESIQRSLELHLAQELMRLRTLGSWRFLMALRRATLKAADDEYLLLAGHPSRQAPSKHQVSAGLSVLF